MPVYVWSSPTRSRSSLAGLHKYMYIIHEVYIYACISNFWEQLKHTPTEVRWGGGGGMDCSQIDITPSRGRFISGLLNFLETVQLTRVFLERHTIEMFFGRSFGCCHIHTYVAYLRASFKNRLQCVGVGGR